MTRIFHRTIRAGVRLAPITAMAGPVLTLGGLERLA